VGGYLTLEAALQIVAARAKWGGSSARNVAAVNSG